jgi:hypothetical protein
VGFSSQSGLLGVRTYAGGDTWPADMATEAMAYRLKGGTLEPNRELLVADPEIGGTRDTSDAMLGPVSWAGDLEFYARLKHLGTWLKAALGSAAVTTTTGVSTHTIKQLDSGTMPYLAIEEQVGGGFDTFRYTDVVCNSLHLEAEASGFLMGTANVIARKQLAGQTPTSGLASKLDDSSLIVGTSITVTYNAVTLPVKSFSLDINNNFEDDDFRLGSFYMGDQTPKAREVTAGFAIRPSDNALWRQAVYGTSAATAPGGQTTKQSLVITCTSYDDIPAGTPATKYSLQLTLPNFVLQPFAVSPSGDDVIEFDVEGRALRPAVGTDLLTAVLKNGTPAIA